MREISTSITFEIADGETVPMRIGNSVKLSVLGAPVWATRSNDTEDYWLQPGHTLRLRRGERLWLSVESGAQARVAFAVPARVDLRAFDWLVRLADRVGLRSRDGWRTV